MFSWECSLKIKGIELELLTDVNMIFDYENGIRGGITRAICHYVAANNKCICNYDVSKESTYLKYPDFKNQYGWVLSQLLPLGGFEYIEDISMFTF